MHKTAEWLMCILEYKTCLSTKACHWGSTIYMYIRVPSFYLYLKSTIMCPNLSKCIFKLLYYNSLCTAALTAATSTLVLRKVQTEGDSVDRSIRTPSCWTKDVSLTGFPLPKAFVWPKSEFDGAPSQAETLEPGIETRSLCWWVSVFSLAPHRHLNLHLDLPLKTVHLVLLKLINTNLHLVWWTSLRPLCSFYSTLGKYVLFQKKTYLYLNFWMCVECDVFVATYVACARLYVVLGGSNRSCHCL